MPNLPAMIYCNCGACHSSTICPECHGTGQKPDPRACETPRTDAQCAHYFGDSPLVRAAFARQLEKELLAAQRQLAELREAHGGAILAHGMAVERAERADRQLTQANDLNVKLTLEYLTERDTLRAQLAEVTRERDELNAEYRESVTSMQDLLNAKRAELAAALRERDTARAKLAELGYWTL